MIFSGFNKVDAASDIFASDEFGDSALYSIQVDASGVTGSGGRYTVMGSNISNLEADMVPVNENASAIELADIFQNNGFPFKYIAIKYESHSSTGNITIYWERKAQLTILN